MEDRTPNSVDIRLSLPLGACPSSQKAGDKGDFGFYAGIIELASSRNCSKAVLMVRFWEIFDQQPGNKKPTVKVGSLFVGQTVSTLASTHA
jgi:hypothetical protein